MEIEEDREKEESEGSERERERERKNRSWVGSKRGGGSRSGSSYGGGVNMIKILCMKFSRN